MRFQWNTFSAVLLQPFKRMRSSETVLRYNTRPFDASFIRSVNPNLQCIAAFDIARFFRRSDDPLSADQLRVFVYDYVFYVNALADHHV